MVTGVWLDMAGDRSDDCVDLERKTDRRRDGSARASIQTKLLVGSVDDPLEREADAAAQRVMRIIGQAEITQLPDSIATANDRVRRSAIVGAAGGEVDDHFESRVHAARGGGSPLPAQLAPRLEQAFGTDFSAVRVHRGAGPAELNRNIQARAFTLGSDIFLGDAAPGIESPAGTSLLAHELTHVIQQTGH